MAHKSGLPAFIKSLGGQLESGAQRREQRKAQTKQQEQQLGLLQIQDLFGQRREERREERGLAREERQFRDQVKLLGQRSALNLKTQQKLSEQGLKEEFGIGTPLVKIAGTKVARKFIDVFGKKFGESDIDKQIKEARLKSLESLIKLRQKPKEPNTLSPGAAASLIIRNEPKVTGAKKDTNQQIILKFRNQFEIFKQVGDEVPPEKVEQIRLYFEGLVKGFFKEVFLKGGTPERKRLQAEGQKLLQEIQTYNNQVSRGIAPEFKPSQQPSGTPTAVPFSDPAAAGGSLSEDQFLKALESAGQLTD